MNQDIWMPVVGFEGYYEISNRGSVRSVARTVIRKNGSLLPVSEKVLKKTKDSNGYPAVVLSKGSRSKRHVIHRMLAEAFIPNPDHKPYIDHVNTDINDYRLENLRWVTHKENMNNPISRKRIREETHTEEANAKRFKTRIERNRLCSQKPVYLYTKDGVFVKSCASREEAARFINRSPNCIRAAIDNPIKTAGGYICKSTIKDG